MGSRNTTCASVTLWVLTVYGMPHLQPNKIIRGAPPPLEHGLKLAREVAFHFLWNPDSKPEVNHVNGDKTNNSAENLEWATSIEQNQHALATGLRGMPKGTKHWNTSLNERKFPVFFVYSGGGILASGSGSGLLFQISLSDT